MNSDINDLDLGATIRGFAVGQKLFDRYTLQAIIGRGGMGVVWLARDEQLERQVALKFLPDLLLVDQAALDELKHETKRSLELTHHHIVRIYNFEQDSHAACISMEYVDGLNLSALRVQKETRVFEVNELAPLVVQLCDALEYAHDTANIVHRDLKPALARRPEDNGFWDFTQSERFRHDADQAEHIRNAALHEPAATQRRARQSPG